MCILIAVVNITIVLGQQINIMKDKTAEVIVFQRLNNTDIQQPTAIELDIGCLQTVHSNRYSMFMYEMFH